MSDRLRPRASLGGAGIVGAVTPAAAEVLGVAAAPGAQAAGNYTHSGQVVNLSCDGLTCEASAGE